MDVLIDGEALWKRWKVCKNDCEGECIMHYAWMVSYANVRNHERRAKTDGNREWKWVLHEGAAKQSPEERSHTSHSYLITKRHDRYVHCGSCAFSYTGRATQRDGDCEWETATETHSILWALTITVYKNTVNSHRSRRRQQKTWSEFCGGARMRSRLNWEELLVWDFCLLLFGFKFMWIFLLIGKQWGRRSTWWIFKIERMERKPVRV